MKKNLKKIINSPYLFIAIGGGSFGFMMIDGAIHNATSFKELSIFGKIFMFPFMCIMLFLLVVLLRFFGTKIINLFKKKK